MSRSRTGSACLIIATALVVGLPGVASAGTRSVTTPNCTATFSNSASSDYAWNSGTCAGTKVRHQYVTGGGSHWTGWYSSGSSTYVATPVAREIARSEHQVSIFGTFYTYAVVP